MNRSFEYFFNTLRVTNRVMNYFFCDFEKIKENVNEIKLDLNLLNALLHSTNIKETIGDIFSRYGQKPFEVLPILIAVRNDKKDIFVVKTSPLDEAYNLTDLFHNPEGVYKFLTDTTLLQLFQNKEITNLVDYVFGIETGMDTNARKNRSGVIMENLIEQILNDNHISFRKQVKSKEFTELKKILGKDIKKFDFVIKNKEKTYLLEVNFYNSGGSKPNEVARAYAGIGPKINQNPAFEFIWITDGYGWKSAEHEIREAFDVIPGIYNLTTISDFIKRIKAH